MVSTRRLRYFQVDAFADAVFSGNPAGVCLTDDPLDAGVMQSVAAENNLSETAFVTPTAEGYDLRWFTPAVEVDLCGHATLASAFVLHNCAGEPGPRLDFATRSGVLTATLLDDGLIGLDFPARPGQSVAVKPDYAAAVGCDVAEAYLARDLMLVVADEATVRGLAPDMGALTRLSDGFGVIVTAPGDECDFVSRFFVPRGGVPEDPVTGSSHTTLIPYWAKRLGKTSMVARQVSKRGGTLYVDDRGDRVGIAGRAVLYSRAELEV